MAGCRCVALVLSLLTSIPVSRPEVWEYTDTHGGSKARGNSETLKTMDFRIKGARPTRDDEYLCSFYRVEDIFDEDKYFVGFEALADTRVVHHLLMVACDKHPIEMNTRPVDDCHSFCGFGVKRQVLFIWAKGAGPNILPKDVAFHVKKDSYIMINVHYAAKFKDDAQPDYTGVRVSYTPKMRRYVAGVFTLKSTKIYIPPNTPVTHIDVSCLFRMKKPIHIFAVRTHAHHLSNVMTGYVFNGSWSEIAKGNPQWPQAFYRTKEEHVVNPGDKLVARCTYNSTGRGQITMFGEKNIDEMCIYYMMYYTDPDVDTWSHECLNNKLPSLVKHIPIESDTPLPTNHTLEEIAEGHYRSSPRFSHPIGIEKTGSIYKASSERGKSRFQSDSIDNNTLYIVIVAAFVVPLIFALVVAIVWGLKQSGKLNQLKVKPFNLRRVLGTSYKGFNRLSMEDSDHELDQEEEKPLTSNI